MATLCVALSLASCAVSGRGEFTAVECKNGESDDDDDLADCADPDCWVFDFCVVGKAAAATTPGDAGSEPPTSGDAGSSPSDAGPDATVVAPRHDAGTVIRFDATLPPQTCGATSQVCDSTQTCIDGGCQDPPENSQFLLRVTSAAIPDQLINTVCYDNVTSSGSLCSFSPAAVCGTCKPDPYVIVAVNEVPKLQTSGVQDAVAPTWSDPKMAITLIAGDILTFTVRDYDPPPGADAEIFSCYLEFTSTMAASAGLLQCYPPPGNYAAPPLGVRWVVTAEYEPYMGAQ